MAEIRIRFRHLQCFLSIAQHRSVGGAADRLGMTQPAVSKTLRELEEAVGTRFFERGRTGMTLTRAGRTFLDYAATSVATIRSGVDRVRAEMAASERHVTVGVRPTAEARLMPHAIAAFKTDTPHTDVRVVTGEGSNLLSMLRGGEVDLVVGRLVPPERMIALSFEQLYTEPLVVVARAGHPLTATRRPRLSQVGAYTCVLPPHGNAVRRDIDHFLTARGLHRVCDIVETSSVAFGRNFTLATDAVWFVVRGIVAPDLERGELVALPLGSSVVRAPVGVFLHGGIEPPPAAKLMIAAIRRVAGRFVP